MAEAKAVATGSSSDNASMVSSLLLTDEYSIPPTGLPRQRRMKGARHQARPAELHGAALRSGRAHPARARGRVLLGTRGPSPSSARDDRVPPHHPVPPGAVAREARSPRGLAADRAERKAFPAGRRSEEHTSELQSHSDLVCRLLLEKKKDERQD